MPSSNRTSIGVPLCEPANEDETSEVLLAVDVDLRVCIVEPLTEEEMARKEELSRQGFDNWSKCDFLQFVKAIEAHGRDASYELIASEIRSKMAEEVKTYPKVFWKRWHELEGLSSYRTAYC